MNKENYIGKIFGYENKIPRYKIKDIKEDYTFLEDIQTSTPSVVFSTGIDVIGHIERGDWFIIEQENEIY